MNELTMAFEETNVTVIDDGKGNPLFELYSTGMALGYVNKRKNSVGKLYVTPYKARIDKVVKNADITCVCQGVTQFLNEEQLYDFMLEAKTEKCKAFKKWVTHEVLPTIRKTGGYIGNVSQMVETYFGALDNDQKILVSGLLTNIEYQQKQLTQIKKENEVLKITNDGLNSMRNDGTTIDFESLAKKLQNDGVIDYGRNILFRNLRIIGVLQGGVTHKNMPYQQYMKWFKIIEVPKGNGLTVNKTVVRNEYVNDIIKILAEHGLANKKDKEYTVVLRSKEYDTYRNYGTYKGSLDKISKEIADDLNIKQKVRIVRAIKDESLFYGNDGCGRKQYLAKVIEEA